MGRYGRDDYDDESDSNDSSNDNDYNLTELVEGDFALTHWVDENDKPVRFPEHSIPEDMICWTKAVDKFKPFRSEYEGYMGNYGNTVDRWYHRAAIVLWKKDLEYASLFALNPNSTLAKIHRVLRKEPSTGQLAVHQITSKADANEIAFAL